MRWVSADRLQVQHAHSQSSCCRAEDGHVVMQMVDLEEVVLPGNARLLYHDNECYDWGTLGWIMSAGMVDVEDYKYFIMINSSVRGPYAPPYLPVGSFRTDVFC